MNITFTIHPIKEQISLPNKEQVSSVALNENGRLMMIGCETKCYNFITLNFMFFKLYAIALPIFFALDMFWLGVISKNFYREQMGHLMKPDVNWIAAIIFYLIFTAGLIIFVIEPAIEKNAWTHALIFGALFGVVTYATYDLTNLAVAKDWPILVTIVDMMWGGVLAASASTLTYFIAEKIG